MPRPTVLFVCVHNAGRSQMAAGYLQHLAGDRIDVLSAGSEPAAQLNPVAVEAMREEGIEIAAAQPKMLTASAVQHSDVVITMGCGDACPYFPGKRYEDWKLDDPAGQDIDAVGQEPLDGLGSEDPGELVAEVGADRQENVSLSEGQLVGGSHQPPVLVLV